MNESAGRCVICKKPIAAWRQYCEARRCYHKYEQRYAVAHSTKAYREYMYFYSSELMRIEWREELPSGTYHNLD